MSLVVSLRLSAAFRPLSRQVLCRLTWGVALLATVGISACSDLDPHRPPAHSNGVSMGLSQAPTPAAKPTPPRLQMAAMPLTQEPVTKQEIHAEEQQASVGVITTADGQHVLKAAPIAAINAFPPLPAVLPDDATARVELLTRPPLVPPIHAANRVVAGESAQRCEDALQAARSLVEQPLILPVEQLKDTHWKEQALRGTELTQLACRGERGEQAATYWRATAFLLHGQYSRAALYYTRIAETPDGQYTQWGYVKGLARMLDACAKADPAALDAWTLAGLLEARGASNDARLLYTRSMQARCEALRLWSKARIAVISS